MPIIAVVLSNGSSSSVELSKSSADPAAVVDEELTLGVAVGLDTTGDGVSPVPASAITGDEVGAVVFETEVALGTEDGEEENEGPELG